MATRGKSAEKKISAGPVTRAGKLAVLKPPLNPKQKKKETIKPANQSRKEEKTRGNEGEENEDVKCTLFTTRLKMKKQGKKEFRIGGTVSSTCISTLTASICPQ
jgi:hypothetical protein